MCEPGTIPASSGVRRVHRCRCTPWLAMMVLLLTNACHAVAAESAKETPAATVLGELTLKVVDDKELDAIYGKGYPVQIFRPEAAMPVILWDEGKRKGRIQEIRSTVVSGDHCDISQQAVRPR